MTVGQVTEIQQFLPYCETFIFIILRHQIHFGVLMKDLYSTIHVLNNCIYLTSLFLTKISLLLAGLGFMQAAGTAIPRHCN